MTTDKKQLVHRILLVDDDESLLKLLTLRLKTEGYEVETTLSSEEAITRLALFQPHLVVTDLRMGEMDGMQLCDKIQEKYQTLPIIILTAHGTIKEAVAATRQGVFGFLSKPFDSKELLEQIKKALKMKGAYQYDQHKEINEEWRANIITRSPLMNDLLRDLSSLAQGDASIFIHGESGTGKELIAQAVHDASPRKNQSFVAVNCSAIPEDLLESELFGHRKGAFTGALEDRKGLFQIADKGTLFLDEIGDMSPAFQVKLLRALQEQQIRPVGSNKIIPVDVRIVTASHRDLEKLVANENFRMDLYYRINVVTLKLPKLSDRREDIPLLVNHFINSPNPNYSGKVKGFSNDAMEMLISYDWPGNVRHLKNVIEHVSAFSTTPIIPVKLVEKALREKPAGIHSFKEAKQDFERQYLTQLLHMVNGNVTQAARLAKRNRTEFYKLLKRHLIEPSHFKKKS
ncbi:MAG: sigma 54-interacting transcriptional regulator [Gammaproteobacteria bacterium]|nr:sigma 54-interacting transcriptional regulator [Gammaproteobacteria bacterium]